MEGESHRRVGTAEHWSMHARWNSDKEGLNILKNISTSQVDLELYVRTKICIYCPTQSYADDIVIFCRLTTFFFFLLFPMLFLCRNKTALWTAGSQVFAGNTTWLQNLTMLTLSSRQWTVVKKESRKVPRVFPPVVNGERRLKSELGFLIFNFINYDFIV